MRTELGWEMMNYTGLFQWGRQDSNTVSNSILDNMVYPGGDARFQMVRVTQTNQELLIPMQLSTSLGFVPNHQISIYTDINWASVYVRHDTSAPSGLYPGETDYDLTLQYEPDITLPSIRVGMIEPSIGILQDDHTGFTSMDAYNNITLVPPYYNEIGGELTYEGMKWLTVNAGVFNDKNLALIDPTVTTPSSSFDFTHPTVSGRVVLWPQLLEEGINGEFGGSMLVNGDFRMLNGFGGFGLADKATFYVEGLYCKDAADKIIRNFSILGSLKLADWLIWEWRYDWGMTEVYPGVQLGYATGFLAGFEFFPLPYIEIRPEYRVTDLNPFYGTGTHTGQWTAQVHFFY